MVSFCDELTFVLSPFWYFFLLWSILSVFVFEVDRINLGDLLCLFHRPFLIAWIYPLFLSCSHVLCSRRRLPFLLRDWLHLLLCYRFGHLFLQLESASSLFDLILNCLMHRAVWLQGYCWGSIWSYWQLGTCRLFMQDHLNGGRLRLLLNNFDWLLLFLLRFSGWLLKVFGHLVALGHSYLVKI